MQFDQFDACFDDAPSLASRYIDGRWAARTSPPPYKLLASIYKPAGLKISEVTPQHYGRCDAVATTPRTLFDWEPRGCALEQFSLVASCKQLRQRQLLFAGDSTMWQLFLSFVLLHGGQLGRNLVHTSSASDIAASVCNDSVRAVFVRSDLLLWSNHHWEYTQARRFDTTVKGSSFIQRAIEADLVIYGLGHHFPRIMARVEKLGADEQMLATGALRLTPQARRAFFMRNLNYTLASTIAQRARRGHHPATVAVLGASTPVSGCSRFVRPISLAESLATGAEAQETNQYTTRWQQMPRFNQIAKWLCDASGARFLDVAAISAVRNASPPPGAARRLSVAVPLAQMRPDAAMARFWPKAGAQDEDCLHFCMPGPVDTWVRLLHGMWSRAIRQGELQPAATRGSFFRLNTTRWLGERGAGHSVEECRPRLHGSRCVDSVVSRNWWWPFRAKANNTKKAKEATPLPKSKPKAGRRVRGTGAGR